MPLHQDPTRFPDGERRAAAWLLGLGAAGVLATCVSYVLAGAPAALPGGAPDFDTGRDATAAAAGWMRAAGSFGMPGDVLLVAGCVLLAGAARRAGTAAGAVGWGLLALSCALFILVDALVGFVLPPVAASGDSAAYVVARSSFDVLFNIGGWTLGLGALLAALAPPGRALAWRPLRGLMGLAGVLGLAVNTSFLLGGPGAPLIGPAVVLTALALLGAGLALGRR
ncbi:MAG: hypothetical protein KA775_09935 [Ottowia sp.]|nr:hypothetical protein [Ottowia sp.]